MHGERHGEKVRRHVAVGPAHQLAQHRHGVRRIIWPGQLPAHQHRQQPAKHHERQPHEQKLKPDDLVVAGEDVSLEECELMVGVRLLAFMSPSEFVWNCCHDFSLVAWATRPCILSEVMHGRGAHATVNARFSSCRS